jgi:hypothetical protein
MHRFPPGGSAGSAAPAAFDINASVRVAAHAREGRERLLRYCARAPVSLERLSRLPDGRIASALRKPWGKQTHRVMQPLELLARLAALVPPPRHPRIRFHALGGVAQACSRRGCSGVFLRRSSPLHRTHPRCRRCSSNPPKSRPPEPARPRSHAHAHATCATSDPPRPTKRAPCDARPSTTFWIAQRSDPQADCAQIA